MLDFLHTRNWIKYKIFKLKNYVLPLIRQDENVEIVEILLLFLNHKTKDHKFQKTLKSFLYPHIRHKLFICGI